MYLRHTLETTYQLVSSTLPSSYFAISENTNIIGVYTILIWPQMIQGQMSRPVNNKILWKISVIEKNRMSGKMSFVGRDCLQSSNLVQIEGCSDAILTTRVKTGWYSVYIKMGQTSFRFWTSNCFWCVDILCVNGWKNQDPGDLLVKTNFALSCLFLCI